MKTANYPTLAAALFVLVCATACQSYTETNRVAVNQPASNVAATNVAPSETPKPAAEKPTAVAGSLATPTEAYKTAYAIREKKDVEGLKRIMSKDILEFFEVIAEAEKKSVDDELKEMMERPQAPTAETRNEKITGDRATLEYLDEKGAWKTMDFVKEGGEWKLTMPKAQQPDAAASPRKP